VETWRQEVRKQSGEAYKSFLQSFDIDLDTSPSLPPLPMHLGYRPGTEYVFELPEAFRSVGVDRIILSLKYGRRPADEVMEKMVQKSCPDSISHFEIVNDDRM